MSNVYLKHSSDKSAWPNIPGVADVVDGYGIVYDTDTAFDAVMRDLASPGVSVYVGPGLWLTRGACGNVQAQRDAPGWRLQTGSRLIGAGEQGHTFGGTTLRLIAANAQYGGLVIGANRYESDGVTPTNATGIHVSDMEVDCNALGITDLNAKFPWYLQGVQLWSAGECCVERVSIINACAMGENGAAPKVENFILCINSSASSTGNVISDCSVSNFYNPTGKGCCSAISLNCWGGGTITGAIRDCDVHLNGERERGWGFGGEFAYNLSCGKDVAISRCRSRGAQRGFNNDTFANSGLTVNGNIFDMPPGVCIGVLLSKGNQGSLFVDNTVILRGAGSSGFLIDQDPAGNKLSLVGNKVLAVGSWKGAAYGFNFDDGLNGLRIPSQVDLFGNSTQGTPAARIDNLVSAGVGHMDGNSADGQTWLWPVPQPNSAGLRVKEEV